MNYEVGKNYYTSRRAAGAAGRAGKLSAVPNLAAALGRGETIFYMTATKDFGQGWKLYEIKNLRSEPADPTSTLLGDYYVIAQDPYNGDNASDPALVEKRFYVNQKSAAGEKAIKELAEAAAVSPTKTGDILSARSARQQGTGTAGDGAGALAGAAAEAKGGKVRANEVELGGKAGDAPKIPMLPPGLLTGATVDPSTASGTAMGDSGPSSRSAGRTKPTAAANSNNAELAAKVATMNPAVAAAYKAEFNALNAAAQAKRLEGAEGLSMRAALKKLASAPAPAAANSNNAEVAAKAATMNPAVAAAYKAEFNALSAADQAKRLEGAAGLSMRAALRKAAAAPAINAEVAAKAATMNPAVAAAYKAEFNALSAADQAKRLEGAAGLSMRAALHKASKKGGSRRKNRKTNRKDRRRRITRRRR